MFSRVHSQPGLTSAILSLFIASIIFVGGSYADEEAHGSHDTQSHAMMSHVSMHGTVGIKRGGLQLLVNPGSEQVAEDYYNRIENLLKLIFLDDATNPTPPIGGAVAKATNMNELLVYFGYQNQAGKGLNAEDLESIDSFVLMPQDQSEFSALDTETSGRVGELLSLDDFWDAGNNRSKVLVSRFFAPKIATYYDAVDPFAAIDPDDLIPGWRKLIRISPRANSAAADAGLRHAYILYNFKEQDVTKDPFDGNISGNNQVILVPDQFDANNPQTDSCYFLVYLGRNKGYEIGLFLAADFDLPGHASIQSSNGTAADSQYYVPTSCAACHGHGFSLGAPSSGDLFTLAKPNYLDTDQWYDWRDFDYRGVAGSLHDVVFDGGKDYSATDYRRAMNVIGAMNKGIEAETTRVEPTPSFSTKAVKKWLEIHDVDPNSLVVNNPLRKPYSTRALDPVNQGGWDPNNPKEMRLLQLLDNHCFRCHSSMIYNVFDKSAVTGRADAIRLFLTERSTDQDGNVLPGFTMPQGRVLEGSVRAEIESLLNEIVLKRKNVSLLNVDDVDLAIVARNYAFRINGDDNPRLRIKEGAEVSISMTSAGGSHDWQLEDPDGDVVERTSIVSGSTPVTLTFVAGEPGTYEYFCGVGSHRRLGMKGKFIVEAE